MQFHTSGGLGPWVSDWVGVAKGKTSKVTSTYFLANEAVTIKMRVRTAKGTSAWSACTAIGSIPLC